MKVSALIKKLQKMPQDAEVAFENNYSYIPGLYKASNVLFLEDENIVWIGSNHIWLLENGKWVK